MLKGCQDIEREFETETTCQLVRSTPSVPVHWLIRQNNLKNPRWFKQFPLISCTVYKNGSIAPPLGINSNLRVHHILLCWAPRWPHIVKDPTVYSNTYINKHTHTDMFPHGRQHKKSEAGRAIISFSEGNLPWSLTVLLLIKTTNTRSENELISSETHALVWVVCCLHPDFSVEWLPFFSSFPGIGLGHSQHQHFRHTHACTTPLTHPAPLMTWRTCTHTLLTTCKLHFSSKQCLPGNYFIRWKLNVCI